MTETDDLKLREEAVSRMRRKRDFRVHLFFYVVVNAMLVIVWALTGGFFWPIFPILGWGIGVTANAWHVYWQKPISENAIRREMEQMRG
jgi:2TM domain